MLGVNRWASLVFSYMEMSLKPGFTGMGLALESVMMGLGPRCWVHRAQPGTRDPWVGLASESARIHWEHWSTRAVGACRYLSGTSPGLEEIRGEPAAEEATCGP